MVDHDHLDPAAQAEMNARWARALDEWIAGLDLPLLPVADLGIVADADPSSKPTLPRSTPHQVVWRGS
jgi:hypothetical protein